MQLGEELYNRIEAAVRQAGSRMKQAHLEVNEIYAKEGAANFVTSFDLEIQRFLITEFQKILPQATYFGEEDTEGNTHEIEGYCFYIDPIDGTTNFIFGYHHSCVSVGLSYRRQMIAGFVYNPYVDEMYRAVRGQGAWLNGRVLALENTSIHDGIVAFGCARYNEGDTDALFQITKELFLNSLSIRNGGSAALDLCRIASASNVAYLELKLQPYDYAAASVIVEEAGGIITQVDGSPITLDAPCSILGGTRMACEEIRTICQKYLNRPERSNESGD